MFDRLPDCEQSFSSPDDYDREIINVILPILIFGGAALLGLQFILDLTRL